MSIHVAIVRRVRPGFEAAFQEALQSFMRESFDYPGIVGATLLVAPPGSDSREFGILRTFRNAKERDEFYASPFFRMWEQWACQYTEGDPERRELHGLEAWFQSGGVPPKPWKMALVTFVGVYPLTSLLPPFFNWLLPNWHPLLTNVVSTALIVALLTWAVMPPLSRLTARWLAKR